MFNNFNPDMIVRVVALPQCVHMVYYQVLVVITYSYMHDVHVTIKITLFRDTNFF